MAIAYDSATPYPSTGGSTTTHTFSHTVTGSDPVIFVGFMHYTNNSDICTGITYNGVALTRVNTATTATTRTYLYFLRGASTGANNVVVSLSTARNIYGGSTSYTGVNSTGAIDSTNTGSGLSITSLTVSTTTVADNTWVVGCYGSQNGRAMSAGTNTTQRVDHSGAFFMCDTNAAQTPAGAHSLQVIIDIGSDIGSMCVGSFDPSVASVVTNNAISRHIWW